MSIDEENAGLPDDGPRGADGGIGRLVQPESELDEVDVTAEEVAFDSGDDTGLSAEEAAMHITDAPPMGDGDGYLEGEA